MIKFKIFPSSHQAEQKDVTIGLKLEESEDGKVVVVATHENGERRGGSRLIEFRPNGKTHRWVGVTKSLPFVLDEEGKIIEE